MISTRSNVIAYSVVFYTGNYLMKSIVLVHRWRKDKYTTRYDL